jgi:predicted DNA-binding transcriptional regulator YafY
MAKVAEQTLRNRLDRVYLLLEHYQNGLAEREIAERLGFELRTANNYLHQLEDEGKAYKEGRYWFAERWNQISLRKFDLDPEEAMVLYLAARLFVKQSDRRHETAETVLSKLAHILSSDASLGDDLYRAAEELAKRPLDANYRDIFRTVMRGYIYRRKLEISYHPYRSEPFKTIFAPYLLEPSAIGFATYAIGLSSISNQLRTYKLERILSAKLTREEYAIPPDFPGLQLLHNSWSIYYGEETVQVILRFHPEVARRIQETNWHPSQQLAWDEDQKDYILVSIDVADTTDLKPWIRTWGANCEVLAPAELRDEMTGEARRLAHLYGWSTQVGSDNPHSRFRDIFGG